MRRIRYKYNTPYLFFALYDDHKKLDANFADRLRRDSLGHIQRIASPRHFTTTPIRQAYVVDLSRLPYTDVISRLSFYSPFDKTDWVDHLRIKVSDDLHRWRPLVDDVVVSSQQKTVSMPCTKGHYLLVTWKDSDPTLHLQKIIGQQSPARVKNLHKLRRQAKRDARKKGHYLFNLNALITVKATTIAVPNISEPVHVKLFSRLSQSAKWQARYSGSIYQQRLNNEVKDEPLMTLPSCQARQWLLVTEPSDAFW